MTIHYTSLHLSYARSISSLFAAKQFSVFLVFFSCTFFLIFPDITVALAELEPSVTLNGQQDKRVILNPEEQAWLKAHPNIVLGYTDTFEPEVIVNPDGSHSGILIDFLEELNRRLGTRITLRIDSIPELLQKAKTKEVDGILEVHPEYADKLGLLKSIGYLRAYPAVFARKNVSFAGPDDFAGKKIAIIDKVYFTEKMVREYGEQATILRVTDAIQGMKSVSEGEADFYIGVSFNSYYITKYQLFDVVTKYIFYDFTDKFGMAIRPDWPEFIPILNKGIASFSQNEIDTIVSKWIHLPQQEKTVKLTSEEQAWLKAHPEIRFAFSADYPPALIVDEDGHLSGQMKDVIDLLNQRLGTDFGITVAEMKAVREMVANKEVAGQLVLTAGNGARRGLLETDVLWETYPVIYGPKDSPKKINALEDLKGKAVSTLKGSRYAEKILAPYQDKIDIVRTDTIVEAFRLVYEGKVDYMIGLTTQAYHITKMRFLTLEPAFVMTDRPTKIVMGVRDDWPKLVEILNKGLKSITEDEWATINNKWLGTPDVIRPQLSLTLEEQAWLAAHPKITLGGGIFAPLDFIDSKGTAAGLGPDYARLISSLLGIEFEYVSGDWAKIQEMARQKQIDGIRLLFKNEEREQYLNFSESYSTLQHAILTLKSSAEILSLQDLSGKRVGTMNAVYAQRYMQKHYPDIVLVAYPSVEDALQAVANGDVEAAVVSLAVAGAAMDRLFITNLKVSALAIELADKLYLGIRKDWPEFTTIINKAIKAIPVEKHSEIKGRWVSHDYVDNKKQVELTPEEQAWLAQDQTVQVRVVNIPPYIFHNKGAAPSGMSIDYLKLISERSGVKFEYVPSGKSFPEALAGIKSHQGPDLVPLITQTPERAQSILFSKDYLHSPFVIFNHVDDKEFISEITDLVGKKIALPRGQLVHERIKSEYPELNLVLFDNDAQAIDAVATRQAGAYIGNLILASYLIPDRGLIDLKIAGTSPFGNQVFSMGIRNDWPELASIINKGLASISPEERAQIRNKYLSIKYEHTETAVIVKWILIIGGTASGFVLLFVFWNRSLKQQVLKKTIDLLAEVEEHARAEEKLRYQATLLENVSDAVVSVDTDFKVVSWNDEAERIYGWRADEAIGKRYSELTSMGYPNEKREEILDKLKQDGFWRGEVTQQRKDGERIFIQGTVSLIKDREGNITGHVGINRDITAKKKVENLLRASEEQFRATFEQAAVGIAHVSLTGEFLRINQKFCDIVGYSYEEMSELTFQDITHPDDLEKDLEFVRKLLDGKEDSYSMEKRYMHKGGQSVWTNLTVSLLHDDKGKPNYFVGVIEVISKRKLVEEALRDSEEKFRSLMEQAPFSIQIFNLNGQIIEVNAAWQKLWGVSEEDVPEVLERYNILEDEEARRIGILQHIEKAFKGESVALPAIEYDASITMDTIEIDQVEANKCWVQVRLYPIRNSKGEIVNVVGIEEDITASKQAEKKVLNHQKRLKSLSFQLTVAEEKERNRLAADLHDNVGQTLAFTRIQLARAQKYASEEKLTSILDEISQSLLKTIQDTKDLVFDLSSPLLNELGLHAAILHCLEDTVAKKHGIAFELVGEKVSYPLKKDVESILFRNVRELLTNVVKHAQATKVIVSLVDNVTELKVLVSDDGTGFDIQELKNKEDGMKKFGLFSIKERMEDMGGSKEIISEPGKGCKVILILPHESCDEQETEEI